jgi:hypothetical protein
MVEGGEPTIEQTTKEVVCIVKAEITQAARLAHEADKPAGKRHAMPQD